MAKYLTRILRGMGRLWSFPGQDTSPPGYDVSLPIQPVDDVGSLARYARAHRAGLGADGWTYVTAEFTVPNTVSPFFAAILPATGLADYFERGDIAWVYAAGIMVRTNEEQIADIGDMLIWQGSDAIFQIGSSDGIGVPLFFSQGSLHTTLGGFDGTMLPANEVPMRPPIPHPVPFGDQVGCSVDRTTASGSAIQLRPWVLVRVLPEGIPPSP